MWYSFSHMEASFEDRSLIHAKTYIGISRLLVHIHPNTIDHAIILNGMISLGGKCYKGPSKNSHVYMMIVLGNKSLRMGREEPCNEELGWPRPKRKSCKQPTRNTILVNSPNVCSM